MGEWRKLYKSAQSKKVLYKNLSVYQCYTGIQMELILLLRSMWAAGVVEQFVMSIGFLPETWPEKAFSET